MLAGRWTIRSPALNLASWWRYAHGQQGRCRGGGPSFPSPTREPKLPSSFPLEPEVPSLARNLEGAQNGCPRFPSIDGQDSVLGLHGGVQLGLEANSLTVWCGLRWQQLPSTLEEVVGGGSTLVFDLREGGSFIPRSLCGRSPPCKKSMTGHQRRRLVVSFRPTSTMNLQPRRDTTRAQSATSTNCLRARAPQFKTPLPLDRYPCMNDNGQSRTTSTSSPLATMGVLLPAIAFAWRACRFSERERERLKQNFRNVALSLCRCQQAGRCWLTNLL
jgi:hypothetical protein